MWNWLTLQFLWFNLTFDVLTFGLLLFCWLDYDTLRSVRFVRLFVHKSRFCIKHNNFAVDINTPSAIKSSPSLASKTPIFLFKATKLGRWRLEKFVRSNEENQWGFWRSLDRWNSWLVIGFQQCWLFGSQITVWSCSINAGREICKWIRIWCPLLLKYVLQCKVRNEVCNFTFKNVQRIPKSNKFVTSMWKKNVYEPTVFSHYFCTECPS